MAFLADGVYVGRHQTNYGFDVSRDPGPQHKNYDVTAGRQHHETRTAEMNDIRGELTNIESNSSDYLKLLNRYHELESEEKTEQVSIQTAIKEGPDPTLNPKEQESYKKDLVKLDQDISRTLNGDDDGKADGLIDIGKSRYLPKNESAPANNLPSSSVIPAGALQIDKQYLSPTGKYMMKMQSDGNLVEYARDDASNNWKAVWASNTNGKGTRAEMQQDGNLVVYDKDSRAVWSSETGGHTGAQLALRDDGNLVISEKGQAIWDRQHFSDPVTTMGVAKKFEEALKAAGAEMPEETLEKFKQLLTPESLAIIAGSLALWAASHAVGIGEVVDVLLLGAGAIFLGWDAIKAGKDVIAFIKGAATADSEADIKAAGEHLAKAVATIGVDTVMILLTHKAGGFKNKPAEPVTTPKPSTNTAAAETAATKPAAGAASTSEVAVTQVRLPRTRQVDPKTLQRNPGDEFVPPEGPISSNHNYSADAFRRERASIANTGNISKPILIKQKLDGTLQIIDGHHRWWVAMSEFGRGKVPIKIVEIERLVSAPKQILPQVPLITSGAASGWAGYNASHWFNSNNEPEPHKN